MYVQGKRGGPPPIGRRRRRSGNPRGDRHHQLPDMYSLDKGHRGRPHRLLLLRRASVRLPAAVCLFALFFLAGFYGSGLFRAQVTISPPAAPRFATTRLLGDRVRSQESSWRGADRRRVMEGSAGLPHGETGEPTAEPLVFQVLSWKPRALYFPKFATVEECETIIKLAKANLRPSTLALRKGETMENTKGIRTSSGVFLSADEDPHGVLDQIERRIARSSLLPKENGEAFNILRYEIGQKYASHYDSFSPSEYGPQSSQRVASFLLYLSNVEEGGETMFPYENGMNMDGRYNYDDCIGLKIKPRQGDGLLFYSLTVNGTIDPYSLHGSCPVIKGEKWVATKWIRDKGQGGWR